MRDKTTTRTCPQCGSSFETYRRDAVYCSRSCKTQAANLEAARGKQLYRLAYGWQNGGEGSFSDLSWLIRQYIKEDKACGRPPPPAYGPSDMTVAQSYYTRGGGSPEKEKTNA